MTTLEDLMAMPSRDLAAIMSRGHRVDPDAVAGRQYLGVDLSLPSVLSKLLWKTFRKTFHRDPGTGVIRGWNVRMEQHGVDGPRIPMTDRNGTPMTFGHYHLLEAQGVSFPRGWKGDSYLDYRVAGNSRVDPAALGFCPLVSVDEGSSKILLGWEIFKAGPAFLPLPLYWALVEDGPLDEVVAPPRPSLRPPTPSPPGQNA